MSSSKKRKRPEAAQQLIDSLLDENSSKESRVKSAPASVKSSPKASSATEADDGNYISFNLEEDGYGDTPVPQAADLFPTIDLQQDESSMSLSLEGSAPKFRPNSPPFAGGNPVVTQMSGRPEPKLDVSGNEDDDVFAPVDLQSPHTFENSQDDDLYSPRLSGDSNHDSEADNEPTVRLVVSNKKASHESAVQPQERPHVAPRTPSPADYSTESHKPATMTSPIDRGGATEIRDGIRVPPPPKTPGSVAGGVFSSSEAGLKQSESLRIAQGRITELEKELERVRRENESLSTAGDTLRRRADELLSKAEAFEIQAREATRMLDEEKKVMRGQLQAKDRDNAEMRARVEEIETRLESNFKKIRVRERELEHRLEIVKMESTTLVSTKDKMILDLKRQIDQLNHEHDYAKTKTQELFSQYKDKQETQRRVVRALRIALTILEGDDETVVPLKKAE